MIMSKLKLIKNVNVIRGTKIMNKELPIGMCNKVKGLLYNLVRKSCSDFIHSFNSLNKIEVC